MILRPITQWDPGFPAELGTPIFFKIQLFCLKTIQNLLVYTLYITNIKVLTPFCISSFQAINEDELEVEQLRRERFMLLQRVAELESGLSGHSSRIERGNSNSKELTGNSSATGASGALTGNESESSISGIVHSVHIRTGQQDSVTSVTKDPSSSPSVTSVTPASSSSQPLAQQPSSKKTSRSISQSDLLDNHQVHIEIKNMSKSQEVLNNSSKARSGLNRRSSLAMTPSVSVVNLKHGSADNLPQMSSKRFISNPNKASNFGQPSKSQMLRPNALLPGRMVMGIKVRLQKIDIFFVNAFFLESWLMPFLFYFFDD